MLETTTLLRILAALFLGALIGLEREYTSHKQKGKDFAGIRTFPLIALFGALCAFLGDKISIWMLICGILIMGILIIIAYFVTSKSSENKIGATSEIAALLTFVIGILCYYDELTFAVIITIVMVIILYARTLLHSFAQKISSQEMSDTLKFAVIAFIILPLLPNQGYGPYEIFNPYVIWLMVVFISGISFVGYIAMKWFGEKGIVIAGLLGGLVSSTAVTTSFAQRSSKERNIYRALVLGVVLANGVMLTRVLVVIFAINQNLFWKVLPANLVLILITAAVSYSLWRKAKDIKGNIDLKSPFTLGPALKFGAFFAFILAIVKIADIYFHQSGVYVVSLISGFADVDAITLSLSQLSKTTLPLETATIGVLIAVLTNIAVKGGISYFFGGKEFRRTIVILYSVLIAIGIGMIFLIRAWF